MTNYPRTLEWYRNEIENYSPDDIQIYVQKDLSPPYLHYYNVSTEVCVKKAAAESVEKYKNFSLSSL